jgi:hypothetical protein
MTSNFLPFSLDLILANKKKSGVDKSRESGSGLILKSLVSPKTALLLV